MSMRDIVNAVIYRISLYLLRGRVFLQDRFKLVKSYQPNPFVPVDQQTPPWRDSIDRYLSISQALPDMPFSCLDVGCNEGFFVFKMAERGGFCLGLDAGRNEIMVADSLAKIYKVNNVSFINETIDPEKSKALPVFDVVIFMSLFHHLARHNGLEYATQILQGISDSCGKYMIFETGQPDEENVSWADELKYMFPDVRVWCTDLLKGCGFNSVKVIGQHKAIYSNVPRFLFLASKL
jgi:SAM-dependent methyltransferase